MAICPGYRDQAAMTIALNWIAHWPARTRRALRRLIPAQACTLACAAVLLGACASKPPAPDWQGNAFAALKGFSSAYLRGNTRLAEFEFARAKSELASTGRADLLARAELTRCAVRLAGLELDECAAYQALATEALPEDQVYAAFLLGQWSGLDVARLPLAYRSLVLQVQTNRGSEASRHALEEIEDPLSRLVAAGALLQSKHLSAADIERATDAASSQGWRRPLLAWLGLQREGALQAHDPALAARLQHRIDLVLQGAAKIP